MTENTKNPIKDQSGQTFVEFILLLAVISIISFAFIGGVNSGITSRWEAIANLVLDDKDQTLEIE